MRTIESTQICEGLPDNTEVKDVALDPVDDARIPGTILRHSIPKLLTSNDSMFKVSVTFRSADCLVLHEKNVSNNKLCKL